ncbi:hypothetical protein Y1Q_0007698 [Alligator mississippiensis]|uniref:Uncharacterized protein n=1 Tax=Alligator mississippiensis TaxID=8496 RepID=A0A151LZ86_ALLMI|nr:hypothetical protein Y1Q_0007698 [Alligator mississippiensis]
MDDMAATPDAKMAVWPSGEANALLLEQAESSLANDDPLLPPANMAAGLNGPKMATKAPWGTSELAASSHRALHNMATGSSVSLSMAASTSWQAPNMTANPHRVVPNMATNAPVATPNMAINPLRGLPNMAANPSTAMLYRANGPSNMAPHHNMATHPYLAGHAPHIMVAGAHRALPAVDTSPSRAFLHMAAGHPLVYHNMAAHHPPAALNIAAPAPAPCQPDNMATALTPPPGAGPTLGSGLVGMQRWRPVAFGLIVGLVLGAEVAFVWALVALQLPPLGGPGLFTCYPGAPNCPPVLACALAGRPDKLLALSTLVESDTSAEMSVVVESVVEFLHPVLHVLQGTRGPPSVRHWYLLLGLRLMAMFFARGAWRTLRHDLACAWTAAVPNEQEEQAEALRRFCKVVCYNRHFHNAITPTWGLSFLLALIPITIIRSLYPTDGEERDREGRHHRREVSNMAASHSCREGSNMAAERHLGEHSNMADRSCGHEDCNMAARHGCSQGSNMAAGSCCIEGSKMAAGQCLKEVSNMAWNEGYNTAASGCCSTGSKMATEGAPSDVPNVARMHFLQDPNMAARRRLPDKSNMVAKCCLGNSCGTAANMATGEDGNVMYVWLSEEESKMATRHWWGKGTNMATMPVEDTNMATTMVPTAKMAAPATAHAHHKTRLPSWLAAILAACTGALVASETWLLWDLIAQQLPTVAGPAFWCHPQFQACPAALPCALMGYADKRLAIGILALSACVNILVAAGYGIHWLGQACCCGRQVARRGGARVQEVELREKRRESEGGRAVSC